MLNHRVVTCRDDADVERTGLQSDSGIVLTKAGLLLRPPDQTVKYFAEHAIPAHAHHTVVSKHKSFCYESTSQRA